MKFNKICRNFLIGFLIGVCMLVPGVSGGTVAVVAGIYNDLLQAVSNFFADAKRNFAFLASVAVGGIVGFFAMSGGLEWLLEHARMPTVYFFIGVIIGGTIGILFEMGRNGENINIPMVLLGAAIVALLGFLPKEIFDFSDVGLIFKFVCFVISGILLGAALILPGISFSLMLVTLGLYDGFLDALRTFDIRILLPLMSATMFGVIVLTKVLALFMNKAPRYCNSLIIGFVFASVAQIYPGIPHGQMILCLVVFLLGFLLSWSLKNKRA